MKKNKKSRITLEFAIGLVLSILILIAVINIVGGLFRLTNDSRQSFYELVNLIKDVSDDPANTVKTTALRMDKETFIIGFAGENKPFRYKSKELVAQQGAGIILKSNQFNKSDYEGCEKNKSCICLCRKFESKMNDKFINEIKCKEDSVFCESFDNFNFTKSFVISRHSELQPDIEDFPNSQFRIVFVEKYKGPDGEMVAVCENPEDGSCVSEEYKKQSEAIQGLNKLAEFIESCKDKEFSEEPCSCGAFDLKSEILKGYGVELSESGEKLKLTLKKGVGSIGEPLIVNTNFCVYHIHIEKENSIDKPRKITLMSSETPRGEMLNFIFDYSNYPIPSEVNKNYLELIELQEKCKERPSNVKYKDYPDCKASDEATENYEKNTIPNYESAYGNYVDNEYRKNYHLITFVKYNNENVCIVKYEDGFGLGYINPNSEPPNKILITGILSNPIIPNFELKEIIGCKYPEGTE